MASQRLVIVNVLEAGVHRWFELGTPPRDLADAVASLDARLRPGTLRPHLRLVALRDATVVARIGAWVTTDGRLRVWEPVASGGTAPDEYRSLATALLDSVLERARGVAGLRVVEANPADDIPFPAEWMSVLKEAGFVEIASAHVHALPHPRAAVRRAPPPPRTIRFDRWCAFAEGVLERTVEEVKRQTADRVDTAFRREVQTYLRELHGEGFDPELWVVGSIDEEPFGFVLCAAGVTGGIAEHTGWILDLGVRPPMRGRGLGHSLLREGVSRLAARGERTVRALIDDANTPSLGCHRRLGFRREPDAFFTYHRTVQ